MKTNHLNGWTPVAFIDDTLFLVSEGNTGLKSWARGENPRLWIGASEGTIDDFAVLNDDLFFLYRSDDDDETTLYRLDPDFDTIDSIANPVVVDAYQDWFA